jgi:hypothetical protein
LLENDLKNDVTILDPVKEKLRNKFENIQRSKINPEGSLMIHGGRPGKYKDNCSNCGIYGHKATVYHKRLGYRGEKGEKSEKGKGNERKFNTLFPFSC